MKRLWHRLFRRPGIQRSNVQWFGPDGRQLSEYEVEEQRILRDAGCGPCERDVAAAALQPDSLPMVWSDSHDPDDRDCACRGCHRALVDMTSKEAIKDLFDELVAADPLLVKLSRQRGRKWTP